MRTTKDGAATETFPVSGAAYLPGALDAGKSTLTHACVDGRAVCGVKNILDDGLWDGEGCTERAPTCKRCLAKTVER